MSRERRRELPGHVLVAGEAERALVARPHETLLVGRVRRVAVDAALLHGLVRVGFRGGELHGRVAAHAEIRRLDRHLLRRARARRVAPRARREDLMGLGADEPGLLGGVRVVAVRAIGAGRHEPLVRLRGLRVPDVVALLAERAGRSEELVRLRRGVRVVAGRAVALAEGSVDRLRGEERLLLGVAGEAQVAPFLDEPFEIGGRVRVVALDALAVLDRRVDRLLREVRLDRRVAADAERRAGLVDEVLLLRGVRRVAGGAIALLRRGMSPGRLLEALGEIGVAGRAQLGGLARQRRRGSRLARRSLGGGGRLVTRGAIPVGEGRVADRVQEPLLARDVGVVAGEAVRLRDRVALGKAGGNHRVGSTLAEGPCLVLQQPRPARRVRVVAGVARALGKRAVHLPRRRLPSLLHVRVAGEAQLSGRLRKELRLVRRVRVVAARAGAVAHRGVYEGLRELRLLRRVAGIAELPSRPGRELGLVAAVRHMARGAFARLRRRVDDFLRQPLLRLGVAARAGRDARGLEQLLPGGGVRGVAGGALALRGRLVRHLARDLLADVLVTGEAQLLLRRSEQGLAVGGVRVVAGGAVAALERLVDDRLLQLGLLVRVTVEAELRLGGRQLRLAAGRWFLMTGRAVRGGRVDDPAEQRGVGGRVRLMAGSAGDLLDREARVDWGLRRPAGLVASGAQLRLRLDEQRRQRARVRRMAGPAVFGRLVDGLAGELLFLVAGEARLVAGGLEQFCEVRGVRRMAGGALAGRERRVDVREFQLRSFRLVAGEAEPRLFFFQNERAHDAVALVAGLAVLLILEGGVDELLTGLFPDRSMAGDALLRDDGAGRGGSADREKQKEGPQDGA